MAVVRVGIIGSSKSLTKAQRAFNRLTRRIATQKQELAGWHACLDELRQRVAGEYEPLQRKRRDQQLALLQRFDQACGGGALSRREQTKMGRIIVEQAAMLLDDGDEPALIQLHDKYAAESFEDLRAAETRSLQASVEAMIGASLGADLQSPDEVVQAAARWLDGEEVASSREPDMAGPAAHHGPMPGAAQADAEQSVPSARSARSRAKSAREQALAEGATRSLRETYRKLASTLHPDREQDPAERVRKTGLMARANQAYEARDLLQLLTLQIEASQVDLQGLADASDERLEHYNRVLKEQSEALDLEIEEIVDGLGLELVDPGARKLTAATVLGALSQDIAALRHDTRSLAQDLERFKDIFVLKAWLKSLSLSRRSRPASRSHPTD